MERLACVAAACLAGALAACAVVDPVDSRYDTISRSLAKARNESILLNLARASHDHPLNFVTIANVSPSMSNTTSFGLPTFLLGRSVATANEPAFTPGRFALISNTTASNATSVSTNFSVSTQETSVFYTGFLKPLDLLTVDYFIRQGYSRELLFWLFTQSVEVDGGVPHPLLFSYRPPFDYGCPLKDLKHRCFREFVLIAMFTGLTIEQRSVQRSASRGGGNRQGGGGGGGGGRNTDSGGGGGGGGNRPETTSYFRFCFDRLLAERAQNEMGLARVAEARRYIDFPVTAALLKPQCGSEWDPRQTENRPQKDTLEFFVGPARFRIKPRSAYGIFEFLGGLIKMQRGHMELPPHVNTWHREDVAAPPMLDTIDDDRQLFEVDFSDTQNCFARTWFLDETYCIPERAHNSKRIFNLLAQLIAIETAVNDLSITPTVRVIQ
jgi:uncharacterized membrane protein YgcG